MPIYNINVKTIQMFSFSVEAENEQIARALVDHHYDKLCDSKLPVDDENYDGTKSKYYFGDWTPMLEVLDDTGDAFPQPAGAIAWAGDRVLLKSRN